MPRIESAFYAQNALSAAPALLGKILVCAAPEGVIRFRITETECYLGEQDAACHAHRGQTPRNEVMYRAGGWSYVYLCYGLHHLLNIVTGPADSPQAVLIRGGTDLSDGRAYPGPARVTRAMGITRAHDRLYLPDSNVLWLEDDGCRPAFTTAPRVGIDYADEPYRSIEWRFIMK